MRPENFGPKLEKKVVITDQERTEAKQKIKYFYEPLGVENNGTKNFKKIESNDVDINITYQEVNLPINKFYQSMFGEMENYDSKSRKEKLFSFLDYSPEEYYLLKDLSIDIKDQNAKIVLPLGNPQIYIRKNGEKPEGSMYERSLDCIKISVEPNSIAGLLALFHELGHKYDPNINEEMEKNRNEKNEAYLVYVLRKERYAWSYALEKLRQMLKKVDTNDLKIFIHELSLGSYSAEVEEKIHNNFFIALKKQMEEMEEHFKKEDATQQI